MNRRSSIGIIAVTKNIVRLSRHPWIWSKLALLQGEKWLFDLLHSNAAPGCAGKIRQASFRITDLCNLRCSTCGQWGKKGFLHATSPGELKKREVLPGRYIEVLEDLVENGHRPLVYIWGGEPMLCEGTLPLIRAGVKLGLPVSIATNGTRVASAAECFVNSSLFLLQISIDGHCAELHNRIRPAAGNLDSFGEILAGLEQVHRMRRMAKKDLPLIVSLTTISKENFRNIVDIYEAFRGQADVFVFYLSWWIDQESAKAHDQDFFRRFGFYPRLHWGWLADWKPDDYAALNEQFNILSAHSRSGNAPPVILIPNITGEKNLRDYYTVHARRFGFDRCISVFQAIEVNSNGDVSPCRDYHDYVVGNIKEQSLTELWESARYVHFRRSISEKGLMPVCSRCCGLMGY